MQLEIRLAESKIIRNLAHPDQPALTRSNADQNVIDLHNRIIDALSRLDTLDSAAANNADRARGVWDWIFQSDGYFMELDEGRKKSDATSTRSPLGLAGTVRSSSGRSRSIAGAHYCHKSSRLKSG